MKKFKIRLGSQNNFQLTGKFFNQIIKHLSFGKKRLEKRNIPNKMLYLFLNKNIFLKNIWKNNKYLKRTEKMLYLGFQETEQQKL